MCTGEAQVELFKPILTSTLKLLTKEDIKPVQEFIIYFLITILSCSLLSIHTPKYLRTEHST